MLGKTEGQRNRWQQRVKYSDSVTDSVNGDVHKLWETVQDRGAWHAAVSGITKRHIRLSN